MRITAEMLREKGARCDQVGIFEEEWPDGAEVTLEHCLRAAELSLDFGWAARQLLPPSARAEYEKASAPAWDECRKASASAWEVYRKAEIAALDEYRKATAHAFYTAAN
jgi:hypothetical protein